MNINVGINLLETNGTATPSIQGASTSVAAFIMRSARGVPGAVQQLTMFADFTRFFGGYIPTAYGAYCIRGFFDNGGATAYVTRAVATASATNVTPAAAASVALASGGGGGGTVLTVTAGYLGSADPGAWGNSLTVGVTSNPDGTFNLVVLPAGATQPIETWSKLKIGGTGAQDPHTINDSVAGSQNIMVAVAANATVNPAPTIDANNNPTTLPLTGGVDDNLDNATNSAAGAARDTTLLAPISGGVFDPLRYPASDVSRDDDGSVVEAALTYCLNRGDCMFVGHVPDGGNKPLPPRPTGRASRQTRSTGRSISRYIQVVDPLIGNTNSIPPTGTCSGSTRAPRLAARHLEGARRQRGDWSRTPSTCGRHQRRRPHRPGEERQRQRDPADHRRGHRHRQLAHPEHQHALALRQRAAALQLREDLAQERPPLGRAGAERHRAVEQDQVQLA